MDFNFIGQQYYRCFQKTENTSGIKEKRLSGPDSYPDSASVPDLQLYVE